MQYFRGKLARHDRPGIGDNVSIVCCSFGDEAILDQPCVVGPGLKRRHLGHGRIQQLHGLYVAALPSVVLHSDDLHAILDCRRVDEALVLRKQHDCRLDIGIYEVAVRNAARNLSVNDAFRDFVSFNQLAVQVEQFVAFHGLRDAEFAERPSQARHVPVEINELAVHHGCDFINSVGEQERSVEYRNKRLVFSQEFAIDVYCPHHCCLQFNSCAGPSGHAAIFAARISPTTHDSRDERMRLRSTGRPAGLLSKAADHQDRR